MNKYLKILNIFYFHHFIISRLYKIQQNIINFISFPIKMTRKKIKNIIFRYKIVRVYGCCNSHYFIFFANTHYYHINLRFENIIIYLWITASLKSFWMYGLHINLIKHLHKLLILLSESIWAHLPVAFPCNPSHNYIKLHKITQNYDYFFITTIN